MRKHISDRPKRPRTWEDLIDYKGLELLIGGDDGNTGLEIYLKKTTVYMNYGGGAPTTLLPYLRSWTE